MRATLILVTIFLGITSPSGEAAWKKNNGRVEFSFLWGRYQTRFAISEDAALAALNRVKPWAKLTPEERMRTWNRDGRLNYRGFISEEKAHLQDLALSLVQSAPVKTHRGIAEHALAFVQSIPYSTTFKNQAGYTTPIGVLLEGKGDCDSKSALLAALLENLGIDWTLVYIPKHILIGIAVEHGPGDTVITQGGKDYVLAETTSEGWKIGAIDKQTQLGFASKKSGTIPSNPEKTRQGEIEVLSRKVEVAKLQAASNNSGIINAPANLREITRLLDPVTVRQVDWEMRVGNLLSIGTYPNPKDPRYSIVWSPNATRATQ